MKKSVLLSTALVALATGSAAQATLVQAQTGPGLRAYTNGGGGGFGGTLGNGVIGFDATGGNLTVSFTPAGGLNDIVAIWLDTRSGGFNLNQLSDTADGGRRALTDPVGARNVNTPSGMTNGDADYGIAIGSFGSVLFELTGGSLNFLVFNPAPNITFPLALISNPSVIDWFSGYTSESGYASNESLPRTTAGFNQISGNPGFGDGQFGAVNPAPSDGELSYDNFNRYSVPAPGAATLLGLGGLVALRRRR